MPLLNFPCPTCGSMVSTVDLAPGVTPYCSGCGRTFPEAAPAIPSPYSTSGSSGTAGAGGVVVGALMLILVAGGAVSYFAMNRTAIQRSEFERVRVQAETQIANTQRARELGKKLEDDNFDRSIAAWHALYSCDVADHDGTFAVLDELYARTTARNAIWNLSNGFQEFYGKPGEDAIVRELAARQRAQEQVDLLCQSLESDPASLDQASGAAGWAKSARILEAAGARVDRPLASQRIRQALDKVRAKIQAEKQ